MDQLPYQLLEVPMSGWSSYPKKCLPQAPTKYLNIRWRKYYTKEYIFCPDYCEIYSSIRRFNCIKLGAVQNTFDYEKSTSDDH